MNEKQFSEFDLEDIIKEFSDHSDPAEETEELTEAAVAPETEDTNREILPVLEEPSAEEAEEVPLEELTEVAEETPEDKAANAMWEDTIRMEPIGVLPKGQVRNAEPVDNEDDTRRIPIITDTQVVQPYSQQWEPEYEQPIGAYTPPRQILYHPQSRLQELKRKLVAGPEKRYYELSEKGLGKLQAVIFLSVLVVLISAGSTVLYTMNMVQPDRMRLMVFGQLLAMLISALLGSFQLIEGFIDLFRGRFSLNTLLLFTFILCCVDGVLCLQQLRVPCCAAFSLEVTFSLLNAYHRRRTEMGQMDTLRRATKLTAVRPCDGQLDSSKILLRSEGQVEDFMEHYNAPSTPESVLSWYSIGALLAAVGVGVLGFLLHDLNVAVQVAAITLLAAVPASGFICLSRPMAILEKRLRALGTVLCGWQGVQAADGKVLFPLSHEDLFPAGAVKMNGVKFFGARNTDEIVAYATAIITAADNGLSPLFDQILESRNGRHLGVTALRDYDGGIGGEVMDEPVLVGTLSFLRTMGVEIPEGLRVSQAVCVAIDGELCGLFAITYERNRDAAAGFTTLSAYRGLSPVVTAGDLLLTPGFLRAKFGINPKRVIIADSTVKAQIQDLKSDPNAPAIALTTKSGLAPLAYGVTGARALGTACKLGVMLHMIGGLLGIAIMLTLVLLNAVHLLTPANVFLYQLVWVLPSVLLTEWTRLI